MSLKSIRDVQPQTIMRQSRGHRSLVAGATPRTPAVLDNVTNKAGQAHENEVFNHTLTGILRVRERCSAIAADIASGQCLRGFETFRPLPPMPGMAHLGTTTGAPGCKRRHTLTPAK